jgi:hypothetical protein
LCAFHSQFCPIAFAPCQQQSDGTARKPSGLVQQKLVELLLSCFFYGHSLVFREPLKDKIWIWQNEF